MLRSATLVFLASTLALNTANAQTVIILNEGAQSCLVEQIGTEVCPAETNQDCPTTGDCGVNGFLPGCFDANGDFVLRDIKVLSPGGTVPKWSEPAPGGFGDAAVEQYKVICSQSKLCWCVATQNGRVCQKSTAFTDRALRYLSPHPFFNCVGEES